jgi:hypothetical protein
MLAVAMGWNSQMASVQHTTARLRGTLRQNWQLMQRQTGSFIELSTRTNTALLCDRYYKTDSPRNLSRQANKLFKHKTTMPGCLAAHGDAQNGDRYLAHNITDSGFSLCTTVSVCV